MTILLSWEELNKDTEQLRISPNYLNSSILTLERLSAYLLPNRQLGQRHPMSALDKAFSIFLPSHCLYKLLLSFPYIQTTSKNTSPNSSWAEFICRGICRQVALRPRCALCWVGAEVKVGEGAGAWLTFFIYVLRF